MLTKGRNDNCRLGPADSVEIGQMLTELQVAFTGGPWNPAVAMRSSAPPGHIVNRTSTLAFAFGSKRSHPIGASGWARRPVARMTSDSAALSRSVRYWMKIEWKTTVVT